MLKPARRGLRTEYAWRKGSHSTPKTGGARCRRQELLIGAVISVVASEQDESPDGGGTSPAASERDGSPDGGGTSAVTSERDESPERDDSSAAGTLPCFE